ncbi:MAG: SDR family NAD(P)-dependent oxidoreductase [Thermoanaerobaculales bacterium]
MTALRDTRVIISGASSGIGLETARRLVADGARVCLVGRRPEPLAVAAEELGDRAWAWPCDVADPQSVSALAREVASRWGGVDGLVNSAGIAPTAALDETTTEAWDEVFGVNVRGPFLMCRELGPLLREGSSPAVVNVSSTLAVKAIPGMAAYNAAKAALNQLTRSLALEWAPAVRVNAVMPAVVDTPIHALRGMSPEQVREMGGLHPLGRVGAPADVAAVIAFLLSDGASWMTGAIIPVDGGMLAG